MGSDIKSVFFDSSALYFTQIPQCYCLLLH